MKKSQIIAILAIASIVISIPGISAKPLEKPLECTKGTPKCDKLLDRINQSILNNPKADLPQITVYGVSNWIDVLPLKTLQIYSLYHPQFYYGQRVPVGQELLYCYGCDVQTALDAQVKYNIKLYIVDP